VTLAVFCAGYVVDSSGDEQLHPGLCLILIDRLWYWLVRYLFPVACLLRCLLM